VRAQQFIDSVAVASGLDRFDANATIAVVLATLRRRLTPGECDHLVARLPPPIGRFLTKSGKRQRTIKLSREEFVYRICRALDVDAREALLRIRSVYLVLRHAVGTIAPEELEHLAKLVPPDLRDVLEAPSQAGR